jgi:hypothetical protein
MNRILLITGLAAALTLPVLAAPATANASCADRKMTGTVIGGVGGALIGNSIARGGGGALVGGLGGAFLGHEIAGAGCRRYRHSNYYGEGARFQRGDIEPRPARYVYDDQFGNPVAQGPTPTAYAPAGPPACHTETQSYYDDRGALLQAPVQICDR